MLIVSPVLAGGIANDLLLSRAWCTLRYNQMTDYSNTTRMKFNKNGTCSTGARAEGSTSDKRGS